MALAVPDGIEFNPNSITSRTMQHEAKYPGVRLRFEGHLEATRVPMQIDIDFGDPVTPAPQPLLYPSILGFPDINLHGYTPETVIAEKLETMIRKGMTNTRLKDFYDLWILCRRTSLDHDLLSTAIGNTFAARRTVLRVKSALDLLTALGGSPAKRQAWQIFREKHQLSQQAPRELSTLTRQLGDWLQTLNFTDGIDGNI